MSLTLPMAVRADTTPRDLKAAAGQAIVRNPAPSLFLITVLVAMFSRSSLASRRVLRSSVHRLGRWCLPWRAHPLYPEKPRNRRRKAQSAAGMPSSGPTRRPTARLGRGIALMERTRARVNMPSATRQPQPARWRSQAAHQAPSRRPSPAAIRAAVPETRAVRNSRRGWIMWRQALRLSALRVCREFRKDWQARRI